MKASFVKILKLLKKNPIYTWLSFIKMKLHYEQLYPTLRVGDNCKINNCQFSNYSTLYENVVISDSTLGRYSYIARDSVIYNAQIGSFCSIGPGVKCGLGIHPSDTFISTHPCFYSTRKQAQKCFCDKIYFQENKRIVIGNDVWIGANVVINDGLSIGDGAIIAAGAIVTKDVPLYAVVGGVPAKILKYRFTEDEISDLIELQWWNWGIDKIANNWQLWHNIDNLKKLRAIE